MDFSFTRGISPLLLVMVASGCSSDSRSGTSATLPDDGGSRSGATDAAAASGGGAASSTGGAGTGGGSGGSPTSAGGTSAAGGSAGGTEDGGGNGPFPPNPCIAAGNCREGEWVNVTPSNVTLPGSAGQACSNYGTLSIHASRLQPEVMFAEFNCQGIWSSSDYGLTWKGPLNTGANGTTVASCQGGISAAPNGNGKNWSVFEACIGGAGNGFWVSTNSAVDWTMVKVGPGGDRQDFYPPTIDPYDPNHLLMPGHERNLAVQSSDGGKNWSEIKLDPGMNAPGGSAAFVFIDTGSAATTHDTWLYAPQATGGNVGTWRTTDAGVTWKQVDKNEKEHSYWQILQPDTNGVVFMAGIYSAEGNGVLRSEDFGQTWAHVGLTQNENIVFGTSALVPAGTKRRVYSLDAYSSAQGEVAELPGTGTWTSMPTPWSGMSPSGPIAGTGQAAVTSDGKYGIIVTANWNGGLWRYVEPLN